MTKGEATDRRIDAFIALWIGLAFPVWMVVAPRIAQFIIGSSIAVVLAAALWRMPPQERSTRGVLGAVRNGLLSLGVPSWRPAHVLLAFCVFAAVSSVWSLDPLFSLERTARFTFVAMLAIGFVALVAPRLGRLSPVLVVLGSAVAALLCLVDWYLGGPILSATGRPIAFFEYNRTAQQCAALALFALWCPPSSRIYVVPAFLFIAGFAVMSDNEAAKLAFAVSVFGVVVFHILPVRAAVVLSMIAFVIVLAAVPLLQAVAATAMPEWFQDLLSARSLQRRLHIWNHFGGLLVQNPILGTGFDATRFGPPVGEITFFSGQTETYPTPFHPHSLPLQVAYETGLAGLAFLAMLGLTLLRGIGRLAPERVPVALALFWSAFVAAAVANGAFATWRLGYWTILITLVMTLPVRWRSRSVG